MAEALLIKDGKIIVGLDNGGKRLNIKFLNENKVRILSELSANESDLEASDFKDTNDPILFVFEDSGTFID